MRKRILIQAVIVSFMIISALNANAQTVSVADENALITAIANSESDISIITADFALTGAVSISNYADLYIRAASTPTFFSASGATSNIFNIQQSTIVFNNIGFENIDGKAFLIAEGSDITFIDTHIKNNAFGTGLNDYSAFIFRAASSIKFENETIFDSNSGQYGGSFASEGSEVTFNGKTEFRNNSANAGAGFYASEEMDFTNFPDIIVIRSTIAFNNAVTFTSNTATSASGGAFYAKVSNINFNDAAIFEYNKAASDGGAGLISGATVNFGGHTLFEQNKAGGNGGSLYITMNYNDSVDLLSGAQFYGNEAGGSGGAIYLNDSIITLQNASFVDNKAGVSGGAAFLVGDTDYGSYSQLNINTVNNGGTDNKTIFQGNTAGGESNALYLGAYSAATFTTASGALVEMYDGIQSAANNAFMVVKGAGDFNLYANSKINDLNIEQANFNLKSGKSLTVEKFKADNGSVFNMSDNSANILHVKDFDFDGLLKVAGNDTTGNIVADNAKLGANSKVDILTNITDKNYRERYYKIINYNSLTGTFNNNITFNDGQNIALFANSSGFEYGDNWVAFRIFGDLTSTNLSAIADLPFNAKQVANVFDKLTALGTQPADLDQMITDLDSLANDSSKKDALLNASGYFLANVIRSAALDNDRQDIYSRIRYHDMDAHKLNGIWVQARVQDSELSDDENSKNKYKDFGMGALAGWDIMLDDYGLALGAYGKYNKNNIQQDKKNEATLEEFGVGVYGGLLRDDWEVKALISGSVNNFSTTRYISFADRKAEADFSGMTFGFDFEGAIRTYVTESILLRPFAAIEVKSTNHDSFKEKNAGDLSLDVGSDNYTRSFARIGLGVGSDDDVMIEWYANVEGKYLLTKDIPEISVAFTNTSESFTSKGAKEGSTVIGLGAGGAYRISDNFKVFANASFQHSQGYRNIYGNLGVRYMFAHVGR